MKRDWCLLFFAHRQNEASPCIRLARNPDWMFVDAGKRICRQDRVRLLGSRNYDRFEVRAIRGDHELAVGIEKRRANQLYYQIAWDALDPEADIVQPRTSTAAPHREPPKKQFLIRLRCEADNLPVPVFTQVAQAVVQTVGATLPEFDGLRHTPISAPERR